MEAPAQVQLCGRGEDRQPEPTLRPGATPQAVSPMCRGDSKANREPACWNSTAKPSQNGADETCHEATDERRSWRQRCVTCITDRRCPASPCLRYFHHTKIRTFRCTATPAKLCHLDLLFFVHVTLSAFPHSLPFPVETINGIQLPTHIL